MGHAAGKCLSPKEAYNPLEKVIMGHASGKHLSPKEEQVMETMIEGTIKFAISLFRALSSGTDGNVFVSPLSVQLVLALAFTGAKGETASQLAKLLSLPDNLKDTFKGYSVLIKALQEPQLNLTTGMFVEASAGVKKEFQANAKEHFQSPAQAMDFRAAAEKSREIINSWVEKQTNNKITDLLAPGLVDQDTRLILVNALHFKGTWKEQFSPRRTQERDFCVTEAIKVSIQMMHTNEIFGFNYDEQLKAKMLELQYEGDGFRMLVILPDAVDGLPRLIEQLENVNLSEKIKNITEASVNVVLPKFKLEETMNLNGILETLGAKAMFNEKEADFSGLSEEHLCVSNVVQKAFVDVDEYGTEVAAATGMRIVHMCLTLSLTARKAEFIADHPFLFIIFSRFNTPLFFGQYVRPA